MLIKKLNAAQQCIRVIVPDNDSPDCIGTDYFSFVSHTISLKTRHLQAKLEVILRVAFVVHNGQQVIVVADISRVVPILLLAFDPVLWGFPIYVHL